MRKALCGPTKRWIDGPVEFWCETHAYGKTFYPTEKLDAEELAQKKGWKHFQNGKWQCPWCQGPKCRYVQKFKWDFFYTEYFKPFAEQDIRATPEVERAMRMAFLRLKSATKPEKQTKKVPKNKRVVSLHP